MKNTLKKRLALIIALALLLSTFAFLPFTAHASVFGEFEYTVNDDNASVTITGCFSHNDEITVPSSILGKTVTGIGANTFTSNMGDRYGIFYNLKKISIPEGVNNIEDEAFSNCTALLDIEVDAKNTEYSSQNGILYNKDKTNIVAYPGGKTEAVFSVPSTVTIVGTIAFYSNCNLKEIKLPSNVKLINDYAFEYCSSLTKINLPNGLKSIGTQAFSDCSSLESITIPNTVIYLGDSAFSDCSALKSIIVPGSLNEMGSSCFSGCENLATITIQNGVNTIGQNAFSGCASIESISIPKSIKEIDDSAFSECFKLNSINVVSDNDYFCSLEGVLYNKDLTTLIQYPIDKKQSNFEIPSTVTSIAPNAFAYCNNIKSIQMHDNVLNIGTAAFSDCRFLSSIILSNSLRMIDENTFCNCSALTDITIPDSVSSIGNMAFSDCVNLATISISERTIDINIDAFDGCDSLTNKPATKNSTNISSTRWPSITATPTLPDTPFSIDKNNLTTAQPTATIAPTSITNSMAGIANSSFILWLIIMVLIIIGIPLFIVIVLRRKRKALAAKDENSAIEMPNNQKPEYCINCGSRLENGGLVCAICGTEK